MRTVNKGLMMMSFIGLFLFMCGADGNLSVVVPGILVSLGVLIVTTRIESRYEEVEKREIH